MRKTKIQILTRCALFAALTAVFSQIALPIGPVPVNLATLAVFCAGALLGPTHGALSMAIWALLGVFGLPVFSLFRSGLSALAGPTGGYIVGYMPAAYVTGLLTRRVDNDRRALLYPLCMFAGMLTYFAPGLVWFMYSTGTGLRSALLICVFPFLPGDLIKIALATLLAIRLRRRAA